jgi:hypothetical protein
VEEISPNTPFKNFRSSLGQSLLMSESFFKAMIISNFVAIVTAILIEKPVNSLSAFYRRDING